MFWGRLSLWCRWYPSVDRRLLLRLLLPQTQNPKCYNPTLLAQEYLGGAAAGQAVLAVADVRLVLEELYELQVRSYLLGAPWHAWE